MRANKKVFWISLCVMLLSIIAIILFTVFKRNVVCEVFLNIFISLVGGAFLSAATAFVAFCSKRKEYIVAYCTDYISVYNILIRIQNWYSHWSIYPSEQPTKESIAYILQRFEDIRNFDYSNMSMILDDFCSILPCHSKCWDKLKEMRDAINRANYVYDENDSNRFSLYQVNTYDEFFMYENFIKPKSKTINKLFFDMQNLQSDLLEITNINKYLNKIYGNSKDNK